MWFQHLIFFHPSESDLEEQIYCIENITILLLLQIKDGQFKLSPQCIFQNVVKNKDRGHSYIKYMDKTYKMDRLLTSKLENEPLLNYIGRTGSNVIKK